MLERFLFALDRHPRACQAAMLALLLVAACFLPRLKFDDSPERWLPASTQRAWKVLDDHFGFGDSIAIGIEFLRPVRDEDSAALKKLREKLSAIEGMQHVYDASLLAEDVEAVPLTELIDPANTDRFGLYEGALWSSSRNGKLGRTLLTVCEMSYPRDPVELDRLRRIVIRDLRQILDEAKRESAFREARFHTAGAILLMDELEKRARTAVVVFLPLSICVGLVTLLIGFRSWRALALATMGAGAALLMVLGMIGWMGTGIGVLSTATPPLISIIAIATTIHFVAYAVDHGAAAATVEGRQNLVRWVGVACLGAAVTTAIGFLMLAFNQLLPVRDLGYQLFAGAMLAFFSVFILSQILPIHKAYAGRFLLPQEFGWWSDFIGQYPKTITIASLVVMLAFGLLSVPWSPTSPVGLKVDVDPFSFFGPQMPLSQARNHLCNERFGLYQLEVVLVPYDKGRLPQGNDPGDKIHRANAKAAQDFSDAIAARRDLGVVRVISTSALLQRQAKFYEDLRKLEKQEGLLAVAQRLLQMRNVLQHLAKFNETFANWNRDKLNEGAIRLTFLAHDRVPGGFEQLVELTERSLPQTRFKCYLAGTAASVVYLASGLISGLASGLAGSALVMGVVCIFLFRSVKFSVIAFLPNAFPIVVVYGMMGLTGVPLNSGTAMVATVALGIALNDTIHFILHYQTLTRAQGHSQDSALRETFQHLGRPVVLMTAVHVAGFMIFLATDFLPLYHFGVLASVAMIAAVLGDTVMLPNLLRVFDRVPPRLSPPAAFTPP
ncbi:MAG: MMPL family transporter [Pirellulales bacterium]|nr:MMPL family transporter [Pirellulales bacterium]